jgi:ribonuclease VapC
VTVAVDTSALVAVIFGEPDAEAFLAALMRHAGDIVIGAATLVETGIVVEAKQGPEAASDLRLLLERLAVRVVDFDHEQATAALAGWRRFGKGRHQAALNLGDCYTYALAKTHGTPVLFKGDDFSQTDIATLA